jgi:two-component system phosphate regulon response regulator PhoB
LADVILVVDDEADILSIARMILEVEGYRVVTASTGEEALLKADSETPDLILLDVVMSGKSGLEVCKTLKAQPKTKHIPVVMFTALGRDIDRKLGAEAGADSHFTKPFTPEALLAEVKNILTKRERKDSPDS